MAQVGRIERIQANTREVIVKNEKPKPIAVGIDEESLPLTRLNDHHGVSAREKESINITDFAQKNFSATRAAEFPNKLRDHLLTRLLKKDYDGDETTYSTEERLRLIIDKNRMYEHKTMQINYTTYDVRRGQDIIHVGTDRCDVMMLSCEDGPNAHPFWYARVLGIYHVNACLAGQDKDTQLYFLHVRWFGRDDIDDGRRRLTRIGWDEENEYGFIDPAYILRACHIAPAFAHGTAPFRAALRRAEEEDYNYYYVFRWSDRDLLMRFRGDGIGHQVLLSKPYKEPSAPAAATGSEPEPTEEGTRDGGVERGSEAGLAGYEIDVDLEARREAGDSDDELDGDAQGNEKEEVHHDSPTKRRGDGDVSEQRALSRRRGCWFVSACCVRTGIEGYSRANEGASSAVGWCVLWGRPFALHVDDRGMFWGTISGGAPGDEIWLDRSWNEGKNWDGGSSLGRTSTPSGATSTRTVLFAARDPKSLLYGGALRACGRAVTGAGGACTSWARPAADRAAAAADALMWAYQPDTAWWLASWWNSAVTITTLMDWMWVTGRRDYIWAVDRTFEVNKVPMAAGVKSGDELLGDFTSRAIDDSAWWGMAWVRAYDLTGNKKYLDEAVIIANYVHGFWDTSTCNGGVWWDGERTYKNAVTIGLYIRLTAVLHNRISGDTTWRDRAITAWNWFDKSGMVNADGLVNDGINHDCKNNGQPVHSYNQGLAIGGALEVYRITGNSSTLDAAKRLADAAMNSSVLTVDGVLTEACDTPDKVCNDNGKQFKGIFMRYFGDLANATRVDKYTAYVRKQADSVWSKDRDSLNRLGQRWNGVDNADFPNARDWRTQASAMGALVAAIGL
ncbi:Six-hairpin glycosidase [Exidia glandulosa HHB12029]|uniref:Six-hairpin glycosidase n=1 Tax=Exidia glandulosa HHB12029 TaxID=1314781 RepID=A0A165KY43_EXIGL|nr:Six-hairpin glycosidase [Exidia glandulosa HHB12029]